MCPNNNGTKLQIVANPIVVFMKSPKPTPKFCFLFMNHCGTKLFQWKGVISQENSKIWQYIDNTPDYS